MYWKSSGTWLFLLSGTGTIQYFQNKIVSGTDTGTNHCTEVQVPAVLVLPVLTLCSSSKLQINWKQTLMDLLWDKNIFAHIRAVIGVRPVASLVCGYHGAVVKHATAAKDLHSTLYEEKESASKSC